MRCCSARQETQLPPRCHVAHNKHWIRKNELEKKNCRFFLHDFTFVLHCFLLHIKMCNFLLTERETPASSQWLLVMCLFLSRKHRLGVWYYTASWRDLVGALTLLSALMWCSVARCIYVCVCGGGEGVSLYSRCSGSGTSAKRCRVGKAEGDRGINRKHGHRRTRALLRRRFLLSRETLVKPQSAWPWDKPTCRRTWNFFRVRMMDGAPGV